eukprot:704953-Rhodomonas_salina.1
MGPCILIKWTAKSTTVSASGTPLRSNRKRYEHNRQRRYGADAKNAGEDPVVLTNRPPPAFFALGPSPL